MDRLAIFQDLLGLFAPARLLDLATGHGKFAIVARDMGWDVTAVDARTTRFPDAPGIRWVQADIREFPLEGYSVIAALGILYHLDLPSLLDVLRRAAPTPMILDTHVALRQETQHDGYRGRLFWEQRDADTAAWKNAHSFWPTEDDFVQILYDCGYKQVMKRLPLSTPPDRTFWVAA